MSPAFAPLVRRLPWIAAGVLVWLFLHFVWPWQVDRLRASFAEAVRLGRLSPDPEILRRELGTAIADSARFARLGDFVRRRSLPGQDPATAGTDAMLRVLEGAGWRIERIQPSTEGGRLLVQVSASAGFASMNEGFRRIGELPVAVHVARLGLRPAAEGHMGIDLSVEIAIPPEEASDPASTAPPLPARPAGEGGET